MRIITVIGWDGRSNPVYRFRDELSKPEYLREYPSVAQVLEQYPESMYITSEFKTIRLADRK